MKEEIDGQAIYRDYKYVQQYGYRLHDRDIVIKFPVRKKSPF